MKSTPTRLPPEIARSVNYDPLWFAVFTNVYPCVPTFGSSLFLSPTIIARNPECEMVVSRTGFEIKPLQWNFVGRNFIYLFFLRNFKRK